MRKRKSRLKVDQVTPVDEARERLREREIGGGLGV